MVIPYFAAEAFGGAVLVTVEAGLFDRMPELGSSGPTNAELIGGLRAILPDSPAGVVLDARLAGELNHRTLAALVALARSISGAGTSRPVAVCVRPEHLQVWNVSRLDQVCRASSSLAEAMAAVAVR